MNYQTPRGTYDILPEEMNAWHDVEDVIKEVTRVYRYQEIRTPYFESTNVFKRENDSSDMVNKEMYTFQMGSDSYTLRPEGTAGVIRAFDQHKLYGSMELPARFYYCGAMFRHERPQKGRQRQFTQFGVENIGAKSPELDAETIALGYDIVKKMGISSVKVLINTLGDDDSRSAYREALKNHFRPEFLNRLDEIIMFKPLTKDNISNIINLLVADVNKRLADKELEIVLTDAAKDFIVENGFDPMYGARPLKRYVQKTVETLAAKLILAGNINTGDDIVIDLVDGKLTARAAARQK